MGLFSKDIQTMSDLFAHQLKDIYYAEHRITKALPTMIKKATSPSLKNGFEAHLEETEGQIRRLDAVFSKLGLKTESVTCPAIDGIIKEAEEVASEVGDKSVLDAALVAAAQAVEHYEIARYGTLVAWAKQLGHGEVVRLLEASLEEEKATDQKLTALAGGGINRKAA